MVVEELLGDGALGVAAGELPVAGLEQEFSVGSTAQESERVSC